MRILNSRSEFQIVGECQNRPGQDLESRPPDLQVVEFVEADTALETRLDLLTSSLKRRSEPILPV